MALEIRKLNDNDYDDLLVGWWKDWGWEPAPKDFLPDEAKGGIMVMDGDIPVCAGFFYLTNSKVAWVDFVISNKQYRKKPDRSKAITLLIVALTTICTDLGYKFIYTLLKNKSLINTYENLGYVKGDSQISEMIKIF
jgi:hypothetical protein